jgi:hypothetical protein
MPGGRNKSIGPIQMTHEEITAVMDGSVFVEERAALTGGSVNQIQNLSQQSQQSHMPLRLPESPLPSISRALEAPPALRQRKRSHFGRFVQSRKKGIQNKYSLC